MGTLQAPGLLYNEPCRRQAPRVPGPGLWVGSHPHVHALASRPGPISCLEVYPPRWPSITCRHRHLQTHTHTHTHTHAPNAKTTGNPLVFCTFQRRVLIMMKQTPHENFSSGYRASRGHMPTSLAQEYSANDCQAPLATWSTVVVDDACASQGTRRSITRCQPLTVHILENNPSGPFLPHRGEETV